MNENSHGEAAQMELVERCRPDFEGLSVARGCKQVDRIPNAPLLEKAVKTCEQRHGHAAGQPTFNSCRHWIGFERQQGRGRSGAIGSLSISRWEGEITVTSAFTSTVSSFSCGRTSRNHPTQPVTKRIAPRILTEGLVSSPAKSRVMPNARTTGQGVGAGRLTVPGVASGVCACASVGTMCDSAFFSAR